MDGVIALYKERGMTSHDCISQLRKILHTKKIGHTGTLDPNVDGVLPICVGQATKISELLMTSGKIYRGSITLGMAFDTEDLDGQLIARKPVTQPLSTKKIDALLTKLTGDIMQVPPMYSAVKVNGHKLYEYARRGEVIHRDPRPIHVSSFKQLKPATFDEKAQTQTIYFEVACSKGTYVRTLAVDFGKLINIPAVMSSLTRIKSGGFTITQCVSLADVQQAVNDDRLATIMEPLKVALAGYPAVELDDSRWHIISNGGFLDRGLNSSTVPIIRLDYQGKTKALYKFDSQKQLYRPFKMFLANN
ncbi:tRNA pseudouridine(55) synthase TruB [Lentilactobacillus raoultii]|uniref:tRNA pseudouridine synthase B n=1 Tax=Lentilactobacillus raoultii TaxID=1987503 RepID=A0ABW3PVG7_9LACO|nr:tRNA pseudouridine(55) synthase TruB [Lentilactobacillus raoultii]